MLQLTKQTCHSVKRDKRLIESLCLNKAQGEENTTLLTIMEVQRPARYVRRPLQARSLLALPRVAFPFQRPQLRSFHQADRQIQDYKPEMLVDILSSDWSEKKLIKSLIYSVARKQLERNLVFEYCFLSYRNLS